MVRSDTLSDLKLTTACLLGYVGFSRFQEIADLRGHDSTIESEVVESLHCLK